MELKPGTLRPDDLSRSMAQAMKEAWQFYWPRVMPQRSDPLYGPFLDVLFVAIAQGVCRHLRENPTAFNVEVDAPSGGGRADGEVVNIETTGVRPGPLGP